MKRIGLAFPVLVCLFLFSCSEVRESGKPLRIAMTEATERYIQWLKKFDTTIVCIDLYPLPPDSAVELLETCSGMLITGGDDVSPSFYGKGEESYRCETNPKRDTIDLFLFEKALQLKMPVLGICRGLQWMNVALGGSLIVDIPCDFGRDVTHQTKEDPLKCNHDVKVVHGSLLYEICQTEGEPVTSNHHQGIDRLAPGLTGLALADDGLIEAVSWKESGEKPFMLGVQWHPERMDTANPLSGKVLKRFIHEAENFRKKN